MENWIEHVVHLPLLAFIMTRAQDQSLGMPIVEGRELKRRNALYKLLKSPVTSLGAVIVVGLLGLALLGPYVAPYSYEQMALQQRLQEPSAIHMLGTDQFGRDILSRIMFGARVSISVGLLSTGLALVLGSLLGAISGFYGRVVDETIMRLMDVLMAFPYIVLAIAILAIIGPGFVNLILTIAITRIPSFARLTRGMVLSIKEQEFVMAARAVGVDSTRILLRHVLPNCFSSIIVLGSLTMATAILSESALSFLGLGIPPPEPTWGGMISEGVSFMRTNPWIATSPGVTIMITILGFNLLGDGLRDALDPRLQG